jgi:hypothetical protein
MNRHLANFVSFGTALALLAGLAAGQDQATSLCALSRQADVVVRATVVRATDPSPEWHRVEFRRDEALRGDPGLLFTLLEPAGACCGRSLFALQPGNTCLLFLQRRGPALHPLGGARGVAEDSPELTSHVRSLLATADDAARSRLLVAALPSPHPRIAADAAHALAALPGLQLGAAERATIAASLGEAIGRGHSSAAALAEVAVRQADAPMLDALLPLYLAQIHDDRAALLRRALRGCRAADLATRLPQHVTADEARQLRAAELLTELPAEDAQAPLQALLQASTHARVQLRAAQMLLDGGAPTQSLRGRLPAAVLEVAIRRREHRPTFRSLPSRPR